MVTLISFKIDLREYKCDLITILVLRYFNFILVVMHYITNIIVI